ncbi:ChaN family lipoprotein [Mucilaginibacter robiniae]|uniref:ChaN family lipoprotein n=1 Tax=Mucilaginibacter robiniae TaxID=2728022 RepID=A0A7L5E2J6_9SPHI|nr:ChaN family lipoprotein [Mucilaginibacter robiniae]QJD97590.1 ChaN family lipoprotein [Mucilaginibacter robiniae]
MKILTAILLSLYLLPCMAQPSYKIYSTARQKTITVDDLINDMGKADVLFYGEEHNDSIGHIVELAIWTKLAAKYPKQAALSMEMFETDCQPVLNEYLNGLIREKNMLTDARAWPNYNDYRPLIELAKEKHLSVIAANAPARYTNRVNRLGLASLQQLDATGKSWLPPLPIDTATGAYYNKFSNIMGGHGSMGGMQLYQAQNLWDATMGWSIARYYQTHPGSKILQINGGFHSEEKLGAAAQVKHYAPQLRVLNVAAYASENFNQPDWSKLSKMADYIILTPPQLNKQEN